MVRMIRVTKRGVVATIGFGLAIGLAVAALAVPRQPATVPDATADRPATPIAAPNPTGPPARVVPAAPIGLSFTVSMPDGGISIVRDTVVALPAGKRAEPDVPEATPDDLAKAFWRKDGPSPGDPSRGTVYIYGRSCNRSDEPPPNWLHCAFDSLKYLNSGDQVTVSTSKGVMTYRVTQVYSDGSVAYNDEVNRLVLVSSPPAGNSPYDKYVEQSSPTIDLTLVGSIANKPSPSRAAQNKR